MTPLWTAHEVTAAVKGTPFGHFSADSVSFDSREVVSGTLFVALKGSVADGHRFVADALARGAAGALVSEPVNGPHVVVADTQIGLEALGSAGRARAMNATVVGVTGSVGKTTVKELIRTAFAAEGRTHASVKSYNNHTGVPLSLARMPPDTQWAVFEMGMNHAGEIARLTAQVRPHIAVITAIAPAHIENLGTLEAIASAKAEIFAGLEQEGTAVIPADTPFTRQLVRAARIYTDSICHFGLTKEAEFHPEDLVETAIGSSFLLVVDRIRYSVHVPAPGRHRVLNALAALAAVHAAGADLESAVRALAETPALAGRGATLEASLPGGKVTVIDESYNANPASMAAALSVLGQSPTTGKRVAVLGAMRELGSHAEGYHRELARPVAEAQVDRLLLVGPEMSVLAEEVPGATLVQDWRGALAALEAEAGAGDVILIKGSNSVGLGQLVAALGETR